MYIMEHDDHIEYYYYSGASLKQAPSKADTSVRGTKVLVPDEFLRNPYNKTSAKKTL